MSDEQLLDKGMRALVHELGPADFGRFLRVAGIQCGNYTMDRESWIDSVAAEQLGPPETTGSAAEANTKSA